MFVKRKIFAKKNSIKKIFNKKKFVEKNFQHFGNFFVLKKKSVEIWLIFEKKIEKMFENKFCNFFIFEKKSRLKCRLISVN